MPPLSCVCPRCGTMLRVKDRTYLNRPIPCPACRAALILTLSEAEQLTAVLQNGPDQSGAVPSSSRPSSPPLRGLLEWGTNVTVVSWAATLLVAGMIGALLWRNERPRPKPVAQREEETTTGLADSEDSEVMAEPDPAPVIPPEQPLISKQEQTSEPVVPQEQGDDWPPADALSVVAAVPLDAEPPRVPPEPPPVDFQARLSQPLVAFRQTRAIPRREVLGLLEEMISASIRYDPAELGDAAELLEQPITFDLQDTTVGDVLAKVLADTNLTYDEERDALRLKNTLAAPPLPVGDTQK